MLQRVSEGLVGRGPTGRTPQAPRLGGNLYSLYRATAGPSRRVPTLRLGGAPLLLPGAQRVRWRLSRPAARSPVARWRAEPVGAKAKETAWRPRPVSCVVTPRTCGPG